MKINHVFFILAVLTLFLFSCNKSDEPNPNDPDDPKPMGVDFSCEDNPITCDLTKANGLFALDLFKKISEDDSDGNIFISPFSISTALTMTANGANSQTLEEMQSTLRVNGMEMGAVNGGYQQLLDILPNLDPKSNLKLANSLWPQEGSNVLPSFLDLVSNYFNSEVHPTDPRQAGAKDTINEWIEDNTDGLVKNVIGELPPEVAMLLVNAIYFRGSWKTEFDPANTHEANFYTGSDSVLVDMMHIEESGFPYFANATFQAIDLAYGDSVFSMSIFLPHPGNSVDDIIADMNGENWDKWMGSFEKKNVELFLPKFKLEYGIKLKNTLSEMGMANAFTREADFTNMFAGGNVQIDDVIHKAFMEVNEEGTEAAAATVVLVIFNSAQYPEYFNVNRPFVFVIRDNKTNSILFMGKMMDPTG